ncbi:hypothetical protein EASAB2608_01010 [Streptomyces sp. EAS-AB2608]|uniref:DUF6415 family natural product biosynthesis protein n=1 Tax=Streptomyces sp. EAS-AB2608 TaxID=2779671 RepID=UPI001BEFB592|nr:DUF6415 family natural product biosynthesis protein [Streptomyces sp. EAS-AB2608]BCM65676.1 hypothetical protein EASAB2608_01010 [Streptomyces sp. EAS-AB2608]
MSPSASAPPLKTRVPDRTGKKVKGIRDWTPPHQREEMERLLERLRAGLPVDAAYDDLNEVLGDGPALTDERIEELTERFRGSLMVLVDQVRERAPGDAQEREALVEKARMLRQENATGSPLGFLRRLAFSAEALLDLLLDEEPAS